MSNLYRPRGITCYGIMTAVMLLLVGCADGPDPVGCSVEEIPETNAASSLREAAAMSNFSIGTAAHDEYIDGVEDSEYPIVLAREFDSITTRTALKWGQVHPTQNSYDFSGADKLLTFAESHGMRVRGHTLVWGGAIDPPNPDYVNEEENAEVLREMMTAHIQTLMTRYKGRIGRWDVVNEPLTVLGQKGSTNGLRDHIFLEKLGPGYIAEALAIARAADPDAKLFINDFFVLKPGLKQDRYFQLVKDLLEAGAPLDGVGFQTHNYFLPVPNTIDTPTEEEMRTTLARFAALGVAVEMTELNVHTYRFEDEGTQFEKQAQAYACAVRACLSVPECEAVTVWHFSDRHPTTNETDFNLEGHPLLFDENYQPKTAYTRVRDLLLQWVQ